MVFSRMCTKYQFQACVILDRSSCTSSWTASMTLVFDCEKCDAWMLVKFILIEIYTAENFDLKSHFINWMVDSLLPFFYLSVLWFRVFESFRFLSSINFLRSSLSTWFFATWWNLSFSVWFRIYYSGYSSGSWSIRQLGTFLVNLMFR